MTSYRAARHRLPTLLLVEDDDGDAKAVERALVSAEMRHPMRRAIDGIDALDILRGQNGKEKLVAPYLLLIDLNMPRMSGIELLKELRADDSLRQTVVFMLTTSKSSEDRMAAYRHHVAGYVFKEKVGDEFESLTKLLEIYWNIVELP